MSQPVTAPMSEQDFWAWVERQQDRYEFVDGIPVPRHNADRRHDQITVNLIGEIGMRLRGHPCRGFTADTAVRTAPTRLRRPDAGVECGEWRDGDYVANEPRAVVEVLSPTVREFDLLGKLDEYRSVASLREIVVVEPNAPLAMLW